LILTFTKLARAVIACALLAALAVAPARGAEPFTFAALGDTPYSPDEESSFTGMIAELNREPLAFVVHVGDFKGGHSECSDQVFLQRREWFDSSHHPWIFIPGDNEWIDCWRGWGRTYEPRERLARLREIFFAGAASLGQRTLALQRQGSGHAYPEHARWIHGNVIFATLNVPGADNNFTRDRAEFNARDRAVREWIKQAFDTARARALAGVVLMMQANPWIADPPRAGFVPLLQTLIAETLRFPGTVLLIHGDTHRHRVDQPLMHPDQRARIPSFTRVEVFGSPTQNWVRIRVIPDGANVRFQVTPGS
jgi:hypothetical protein